MSSEKIIKETIINVVGFANRLAVPRRILDFCGRLPIYNVEDVAMMDTDASITDMPGIKKSKPQVIFRESKKRKTLVNTGILNTEIFLEPEWALTQ